MKKLKQGEPKKDYLRDDFGYYYLDDSGKKHYVKDLKGQEVKGALIYKSIDSACGQLKEQGLDDLATQIERMWSQGQDEAAIIKFLRDKGVVVGQLGTFKK